jgi:hypothetical protein
MHASGRGARSLKELVDEERRELVATHELERLLEVLLGLGGEAADHVRKYVHARHSSNIDRRFQRAEKRALKVLITSTLLII